MIKNNCTSGKILRYSEMNDSLFITVCGLVVGQEKSKLSIMNVLLTNSPHPIFPQKTKVSSTDLKTMEKQLQDARDTVAVLSVN